MAGENLECELAVIGGGSAGYAAARTAAAAGVDTVVLEGGAQVGGLCILRGCMPTKALLYASEVLHLARQAHLWGLATHGVDFDFQAVMSRKDRLIAEFADYRRLQLEKGPFRFIRAFAKFLDPHLLQLSTGATLRARSVILATGSVVAEPPLPQLRAVGFLTSDDALAMERLPKSLIVLGGGAVAVEFAQFFARFGVRVILVQRSSHILKSFDPDVAGALETALRREGIQLHTGTTLVDAWRDREEKGVSFRTDAGLQRVQAEEILVALGRRPNLGSLDLEKAGLSLKDGAVETDLRMRTRISHIHAVGDCSGQHEIVHVAVQQGEIAAHNVAHPQTPRDIDDRLLLMVIFTDPQVAMVGLSETEAARQHIPFRTASYPFNDHGKSLIMEAKDGFVKLLADPRTGEILGGACVGPLGGELIHEIVAAMHSRMTVQQLAAMPHYHPTLAEIWTYPAEELSVNPGA